MGSLTSFMSAFFFFSCLLVSLFHCRFFQANRIVWRVAIKKVRMVVIFSFKLWSLHSHWLLSPCHACFYGSFCFFSSRLESGLVVPKYTLSCLSLVLMRSVFNFDFAEAFCFLKRQRFLFINVNVELDIKILNSEVIFFFNIGWKATRLNVEAWRSIATAILALFIHSILNPIFNSFFIKLNYNLNFNGWTMKKMICQVKSFFFIVSWREQSFLSLK